MLTAVSVKNLSCQKNGQTPRHIRTGWSRVFFTYKPPGANIYAIFPSLTQHGPLTIVRCRSINQRCVNGVLGINGEMGVGEIQIRQRLVN